MMNNAATRADLEDGMSFWEQRTGKKLFDVRGAWNGANQPFSGDVSNPDSIFENIVYMPPSWPFAPGYVGMTVLKPFDSGQMAMVMINPNTAFCNGDCAFDYNRTSLRKTFAHEFGHFLGLQHVADPSNIMYATSRPGGTLNTLNVDDHALQSVTSGAH
ncbi:MAG: matrixin family metalloprotease [Bdellovibrionales bacterium]|nr:matrixin family metalloprotease [Bdellovibrionales bacterium]